MSISSIGNTSIMGDTTSSSAGQPSAAETAETDQSFQALIGGDDDSSSNPDQTLAEITQGGANGYWAWQVQQMKEQAATQVMGSMDLTPAKIAGMDAKDRVATEQKIEQLVAQKVKQEIAAQSQKKQQQTLAASASMQSIITATQSIDQPGGKKDPSATQPADPSNPTDLLFLGAA